MNKTNIISIFAVLGLVSGMVSFCCLQSYLQLTMANKALIGTPPELYVTWLIPGFFLGTAIAIASYLTKKVVSLNLLFKFILISTLGSAIDMFLQDFFFRNTSLTFITTHFIANTLGVFIMLTGFHLFLSHLSKIQFVLLGLLGGVLLLLPFLGVLQAIPFLFLLYPTVIAGALGWKLTVNQNKTSKK